MMQEMLFSLSHWVSQCECNIMLKELVGFIRLVFLMLPIEPPMISPGGAGAVGGEEEKTDGGGNLGPILGGVIAGLVVVVIVVLGLVFVLYRRGKTLTAPRREEGGGEWWRRWSTADDSVALHQHAHQPSVWRQPPLRGKLQPSQFLLQNTIVHTYKKH